MSSPASSVDFGGELGNIFATEELHRVGSSVRVALGGVVNRFETVSEKKQGVSSWLGS